MTPVAWKNGVEFRAQIHTPFKDGKVQLPGEPPPCGPVHWEGRVSRVCGQRGADRSVLLLGAGQQQAADGTNTRTLGLHCVNSIGATGNHDVKIETPPSFPLQKVNDPAVPPHFPSEQRLRSAGKPVVWFFLGGDVGPLTLAPEQFRVAEPGGGGQGGADACGRGCCGDVKAGDKGRMWAKREKLRAGGVGLGEGSKEPHSAKQRNFKGAEKAGVSPWVPQALSSISSWCP